MIKKTLYFGNPVYLSLRNAQLVIKLPDVEKATALPEVLKKQAEVTKPIEDIGIVVLDNKQITITSGVLEALLENTCSVITCDSKSMPVGLMLPLYGNTTGQFLLFSLCYCSQWFKDTNLKANHNSRSYLLICYIIVPNGSKILI